MASIEYIQKRIAGKEKELKKLEQKLARIRKAEAGGWGDDCNPYGYSKYDLRYCLNDIVSAMKALEDYNAQLTVETEKASSRNVKAIVDFIELWKVNCRKHYLETLPEYAKAKEEWFRKSKEHAEWSNNGGWRDPEAKKVNEEYKCYRAAFHQAWASFENYVAGRRGAYVIDMGKLNKDLEQEGNRKYDFIIERTNAIVGMITDASGLRIGDKHDLNGYIIGTKGTAKVETIGAGGYNIQCFHFRTLINRVA